MSAPPGSGDADGGVEDPEARKGDRCRGYADPLRISELNDYLAAHHPDDYLGLRVTGATSVEVRVVRSSAVSRRELCAMFPRVSIAFAPAWYSRAAAELLRREISAEWPEWGERGVRILELTIDRYGLVVVGVDDPPSVSRQLFDRYGDTRIRVEQGEEAEFGTGIETTARWRSRAEPKL